MKDGYPDGRVGGVPRFTPANVEHVERSNAVMGHTPGPWEADFDDVVDSEGYRIAAVSEHDGQYEANARLIAAAPDMLAALRDVTETHNGKCDSCGCQVAPEGYCGCEVNDGDLVTHQRRCRARMAIAKAEGK